MLFELFTDDGKNDKPNVLVDQRGHVRLSDFGLATRLPAAGSRQQKRSFAGTVQYAAPELLLKQHTTFGAEIDCWALGCLLFELLSGRPPHDAPTARETFASIVGNNNQIGRPGTTFRRLDHNAEEDAGTESR